LEDIAMLRDLHDNLDFKRGISPTGVLTNSETPYVSQILDMQGLSGAEFVILTGTNTDATATFAVLAEEGEVSTLSDNTTVNAADLLGTSALASFTFADDNKVFKLGFLARGKRYKRVTITPTSNDSGDALVAAVWITAPLKVPTANPPT